MLEAHSKSYYSPQKSLQITAFIVQVVRFDRIYRLSMFSDHFKGDLKSQASLWYIFICYRQLAHRFASWIVALPSSLETVLSFHWTENLSGGWSLVGRYLTCSFIKMSTCLIFPVLHEFKDLVITKSLTLKLLRH